MNGRSNRPRGDRKIHAVDPDHHGSPPGQRTMCGPGVSRRYTTANSAGAVNCEDCRRAVGRAIEADYYGELFDWSALLLPRGRRPKETA